MTAFGLLGLSTQASAQWCLLCHPEEGTCYVDWGEKGFFECHNVSGGGCLLLEPGCGISPAEADFALDGSFLAASHGSETATRQEAKSAPEVYET